MHLYKKNVNLLPNSKTNSQYTIENSVFGNLSQCLGHSYTLHMYSLTGYFHNACNKAIVAVSLHIFKVLKDEQIMYCNKE